MVVAPKTQNIASLSEFLGPKNLTKSDPSSSCPGASHHSLQPSGSRVSGFTPLFTRPTQTVPAISSAMPVSSAGSGTVDVLRWRVPPNGSVGIYGYLWVSMGIYGYLWVSMGIYGFLWVRGREWEKKKVRWDWCVLQCLPQGWNKVLHVALEFQQVKPCVTSKNA